jgi:hypothetical protein
METVFQYEPMPYMEEDLAVCIDELAKHDLNGRQIHNVIDIASDFAVDDEKALSCEFIDAALTPVTILEQSLSKYNLSPTRSTRERCPLDKLYPHMKFVIDVKIDRSSSVDGYAYIWSSVSDSIFRF